MSEEKLISKKYGLIFTSAVCLSLPINLYIVIYWVSISAIILLLMSIGGVGVPKRQYSNKYKAIYFGILFSLFSSFVFGVILSENGLIS